MKHSSIGIPFETTIFWTWSFYFECFYFKLDDYTVRIFCLSSVLCVCVCVAIILLPKA